MCEKAATYLRTVTNLLVQIQQILFKISLYNASVLLEQEVSHLITIHSNKTNVLDLFIIIYKERLELSFVKKCFLFIL